MLTPDFPFPAPTEEPRTTMTKLTLRALQRSPTPPPMATATALSARRRRRPSLLTYRFRLGGKETEPFGPYPKIGLDEARRLHAKARARSQRIDPRAAKKSSARRRRRKPIKRPCRPSRPLARWPTSISRPTRPHGAIRSTASNGSARSATIALASGASRSIGSTRKRCSVLAADLDQVGNASRVRGRLLR